MKRAAMCLLVLSTLCLSAQDVSFRLASALGLGFAPGDLKSYGVSASLEPGVLLFDNIIAGIRLEADLLRTVDYKDAINTHHIGSTYRSAFSIRAGYYFLDQKFRSYIAASLGRYNQGEVHLFKEYYEESLTYLETNKDLGFAPEIGIEFETWRIVFYCNIIPGPAVLQLIDLSYNPYTRNVSRNYIVISLSFDIYKNRTWY